MAFLVVAGTQVAVAPGGGSMTQDEVGDRHRAFDGTYRMSVTNQPQVWKVRTAPLPRATANTIRGLLNNSTQPQQCSGDLLGSTDIDLFSQLDGWSIINSSTDASGGAVVMSFTLYESS
jgi:hypothetical protein